MISRKVGWILFLLLPVLAVQPVQSGVYLRFSDTGAFELTNQPGDETFTLITGSRTLRKLDETDKAVDFASGKHGIPESLILSIIKNNDRDTGGIMGLSPEFQKTISGTSVRETRKNIIAGTGHLKSLLSRYGGNLSLAIGAFYAGAESVDRSEGLPDTETRKFVRTVKDAFGKIDDREEIFYTYRNSNGVLTVVNITS